MTDQTGINGNISEDPLFCFSEGDDYTVAAQSPCLPGNNDCGVLMGVYGAGCTLTSASEAPVLATLGQNFPNPFNPETSISFTLHEAGSVTLSVYNTAGQKLITLVSGRQSAGSHTVVWDGRDAAGRLQGTGIYFYRLETETEQINRKMTLLK